LGAEPPRSEDLPWSPRKDGVALRVRLAPKSAREAVEGIEHLADGSAVLKIRVRAVPEAGAANEALIRLLAKALKLPASAIELESGATARIKCLHIFGDPPAIAVRLAALITAPSSP